VARLLRSSSRFNRAFYYDYVQHYEEEEGQNEKHEHEHEHEHVRNENQQQHSSHDFQKRTRRRTEPSKAKPSRALDSVRGRSSRRYYHQSHTNLRKEEDTAERCVPGSVKDRSRYSKVNGADLYVVRITKKGMGCARPCWRCIDWCQWAGIKRIFHWNAIEGRFLCVKVGADVDGDSGGCLYQTQADRRLFESRVCDPGTGERRRTLIVQG